MTIPRCRGRWPVTCASSTARTTASAGPSPGTAALDALKELKLRDEQVGLLLADHRMPGMTGVEFLEQARQFYPKARRVLLTAYADTDAAIAAINRADVHYYLLKPWDPPQEKLYPVLDDLLEDWKMQDRLKSDDRIRVVGHRWSAPSHESRTS